MFDVFCAAESIRDFLSLLVTYTVTNDHFFSGHTGIAVFGAIEISRSRETWLTLRAHYAMDVFAGLWRRCALRR